MEALARLLAVESTASPRKATTSGCHVGAATLTGWRRLPPALALSRTLHARHRQQGQVREGRTIRAALPDVALHVLVDVLGADVDLAGQHLEDVLRGGLESLGSHVVSEEVTRTRERAAVKEVRVCRWER